MPHIPQNSQEPWNAEEIAELLRLVQDKVPVKKMRQKLGRSVAAIQGRLNKIKRESGITQSNA